MEPLRIDIGCGHARRPGYVGVDKVAGATVDHVVDVEREPLPFADRSVAAVFSAHCLEHLAEHALVFNEISRVARDGAALEILTPYAWTDEAFIYTLVEVQFVITDDEPRHRGLGFLRRGFASR